MATNRDFRVKNGLVVDGTGTSSIAGSLGIGTTNPQGNLHVVGETGDAARIYVSDADDGTGTGDSLLITKSGDHAYIYNRDSSGDLRLGAGDNSGWLTIADDGKVGIGDTNPLGAKLHVEQENDTTVYANTNETFRYTMLLRNNTVATNAFSGIAFDVSTESDFDSLSASIAAIRDTSAGSTAGNHDANLAFATNDAGDDGLTERMRITHDGLVGIGNTSPSQKLDVTGNFALSGNAVIGGDLTVSGTTTTLNTQTIEVEDNIIQLNTTQGSPDTATATTSGIEIYRGDGVTAASLKFLDASSDKWQLNNGTAAMDFYMTGGVSEMSANSNSLYLTTKRDSDDIHLRTGTTETTRLFVEGDTGRVGIGTTSPESKLEVVGALNPSSATQFTYAETLKLDVENSGTATGPALRFRHAGTSDNQTADYMFQLNSDGGNITAHEYSFNWGYSKWLHAANADGFKPIMRFNHNGSTAASGTVYGEIELVSTATVWDVYDGTHTGLNPATYDSNLKLSAGADSYFNGGDVGIGTTSPTFTSGGGLHIKNSSQANVRLEENTGEYFDMSMLNGIG
jgi:hypothetical protein